MSKKITSGLTASRQTKVLDCLDEMARRRENLRTLAGLLELCGSAPHNDLDGGIVASAAGMMSRELRKMRDTFKQLEKEVLK